MKAKTHSPLLQIGTLRPVMWMTLLLVATTTYSDDLIKLAPSTSLVRRPVAIARLSNGEVLVANRDSRTLSLVDTHRREIIAEYAFSGTPTALASLGEVCLVADSENDCLIGLKIDREQAAVLWRISLPDDPQTIRVSPDLTWCSVCCSWSRKVVFIKCSSSEGKITSIADLPFSPREQVMVDQSRRLLVADAYGDRIAVIRTTDGAIESLRTIPGNNLRGLTVSSDGTQVLLTQQILSEITPPIASEMVWGSILADSMRAIDMDVILDPDADLSQGSHSITIGNDTRGAGDPEDVLSMPDGRLVVAIGGVSELAVMESNRRDLKRISTHRRPVAMASLDDHRVAIANQFSDSISFLEILSTEVALEKVTTLTSKKYANDSSTESTDDEVSRYQNRYKPRTAASAKHQDQRVRLSDGKTQLALRHLSLGDSPALSSAQRGETLFFDAHVSRANWFSCHSCHTDGHSNGFLADTLSDGGEGAPKRILSLRGAGQTKPWAWIGDKNELGDQIHQTLQLTMQGRKLDAQQQQDLVAFIRTLPPPPPFQPAVSPADQKLINRGRRLFRTLECNSCHAGKTYTSEDAYDVGLTDARGTTEFNPPSLRGVGHRRGLFHNKSAATIEDVIHQNQHQLPRKLSAKESAALIRFLKSL